MIDADQLAERFTNFLGEETEAAARDGNRIALLTPAEYPDCDAVTVSVQLHPQGGYQVSDNAGADALLVGYLNPRGAANKAEVIAARFDVAFDRGHVVARVEEDGLPEACWRVAQASAAIAEAVSFTPAQPTPSKDFESLVTGALERQGVDVKRQHILRGLSGHEHSATLFVPASEAVVEPITGRKSWDRATKVYAEFGDLRQANGYRLVAVLDDRDAELGQEASLLSQVGQVATWSHHEEWARTVAGVGGKVTGSAPKDSEGRRGAGRRKGRRRPR